mmetsp:Transcript_35029/g.100027  ORF Transcript_35029/g.100027 Transcript_35029/m.100027 type:complete len:351 (+) Transcript_35029:320-1372(+)
MEPCHRRRARRKFLLQVNLRAPKEHCLPTRDVVDADALRQVLPAQDGCCGSDRLRPVLQEAGVDGRQLDQVVCQAEALVRPASLPQISAQEGVGRGLVQFEAQRLVNPARRLVDLTARARPIRHEGKPRGQFGAVACVVGAAAEAGHHQHAGDAGELQLGAPRAPAREVDIHEAEGAEEQVLRVGLVVERNGRIAAVVDLGEPVKERCPHPARDERLRGRHRLVPAGRVELQEHLAARGRQHRPLAGVGQLVAPEVELLECQVIRQGLCNGLGANVSDDVVSQREPADRGADRGTGAQDRRDLPGTCISNVVGAHAELADGAVLRGLHRQHHGPSSNVAQAQATQVLAGA